MQLNYDLLAVTLFLRSSLLLFTNLWVLKALDYENKDLCRKLGLKIFTFDRLAAILVRYQYVLSQLKKMKNVHNLAKNMNRKIES